MKKLTALAIVAISLVSTAAVHKPKALLIMLDGARADAVAAARMPAVSSLRDGS